MAVKAAGATRKSLFPYNIVCAHCGEKLIVESPSDIEERETGMHYSPEMVLYVDCVICGKHVDIPVEDREDMGIEMSRKL